MSNNGLATYYLHSHLVKLLRLEGLLLKPRNCMHLECFGVGTNFVKTLMPIFDAGQY